MSIMPWITIKFFAHVPLFCLLNALYKKLSAVFKQFQLNTAHQFDPTHQFDTGCETFSINNDLFLKTLKYSLTIHLKFDKRDKTSFRNGQLFCSFAFSTFRSEINVLSKVATLSFNSIINSIKGYWSTNTFYKGDWRSPYDP